jgi:hypothetical protein
MRVFNSWMKLSACQSNVTASGYHHVPVHVSIIIVHGQMNMLWD